MLYRPVTLAFAFTYRAPARHNVAEHVWLLGLVVIGWQIALSYADVTGVPELIAHSR